MYGGISDYCTVVISQHFGAVYDMNYAVVTYEIISKLFQCFYFTSNHVCN